MEQLVNKAKLSLWELAARGIVSSQREIGSTITVGLQSPGSNGLRRFSKMRADLNWRKSMIPELRFCGQKKGRAIIWGFVGRLWAGEQRSAVFHNSICRHFLKHIRRSSLVYSPIFAKQKFAGTTNRDADIAQILPFLRLSGNSSWILCANLSSSIF